MRSWLRTGRVLLAAASASSVAAPSLAAELVWREPSECSDEATVTRRVEGLIGRNLGSVDGMRFDVSVERRGAGFRLEIATSLANGERSTRQLEGKTCDEVSAAAAVAIAMTIQSEAPEAEQSSETHGEQASLERASRPEPLATRGGVAARRADEGAPSAALRGAFGAGVTSDSSALPGLALGVDVGAALLLRSARFEVRGAMFPPRSRVIERDDGGDFSLLAGSLLACATISQGRVLGCFGYELGRISGEGRGVKRPRLGSALWQAALVEAGLAWPLSETIRLTLRAGLSTPLSRPAFELDGVAVHRSGALAARASLGIEFWR